MKKEYTTPTIVLTKCQLEGIIAASPGHSTEQDTPAGDGGSGGGDIPSTDKGDGQKAKEHFNAWTAWED